jgi:hypothetical protein
MLPYIEIDSIIPRIPKPVREESSYTQMLADALAAYRQIGGPIDHLEERISIFKVVNHKVELPLEVHSISLVTKLCNEPTDEQCKEFEALQSDSTTETSTCSTGNYQIFHQLFLDSSYYNNCYCPMKYVGPNTPLCEKCVNRFCHGCNETFSVDHNRVLTTSFADGYICVVYDRQLKRNGKFLIVDDEVVKEYLATHVTWLYAQNQLLMREDGGQALFDRYQTRDSIWANKAAGRLRLLGLNLNAIRELTVDRYNAVMMRALPYWVRDKYEFNYGRE